MILGKTYLNGIENKLYLGNVLIYYPTITALKPIMTNFRTDDTNKNRIYFDAPLGSVAGIDYTDFIITGKTITAVNTTDNYFTLSTTLNYYDNILIRKEGGNNTVVYDFTLQYIENLIYEPQTVNEKFVEVGASGSGDSLGDPMSITAAFTQASANTTYWVKQGDYSSVNCTVGDSGTADQPVKFIGYKTTPGDNPTLTRSLGMAFDSSEMPLLQNGSGAAIRNAQDYIFIRNFQLDNYAEYGINYSGAFFATYDNIFVKECQWSIRTIDEDSTNNRVTNSYVADSSQTGVEVQNNYNLIKNTWAVTSYASSMDYYLTHRGGEEGYSNCFIDCYVNRFTGDSHSGHGVSFRGDAYEANDSPSTLSLVQDCEIIGTKLELRNRMVYNNVFRNITITDGTGINLNDGANYNTLENVIVKNCAYFVNFYQSVENGGVNENANHNIFKNCIADDVPYIFTLGTYDISEPVQTYIQYNEWLNCTFINSPSLWVPLAAENHVEIDNTNKFTNCIIEDIDSKGSGISDITYTYCDFWNSWAVESGMGNFSINPDLDANYQPQSDFSTIDAPRIDGVYYGKNGNERQDPTTVGSILSAEEVPNQPPVEEYDFYVSTSGDNTDGLTEATAWNSLASLQSNLGSLSAGDVIGLKGGDEFSGELTFSNINGASGNPITFTSYGTGQAIIGGGNQVAGAWTFQNSATYIDVRNIMFNDITSTTDVYHQNGIMNWSSNIGVYDCIFDGTQHAGISLEEGSDNIVQGCQFNNNSTCIGVFSTTGGIEILENAFLNPIGEAASMEYANFVQFNGVSGAGNKCNDNVGEGVIGYNGLEDHISTYTSGGISGSPLEIKNNQFRGSSESTSGGGIMTGDYGGSYIDATDNILVNPGQYGMAIAGGTNINFIDNTIYNKSQAFSGTGIYVWMQAGGSPCQDHVLSGNVVDSYLPNGNPDPYWYEGNCSNVDDGSNSFGGNGLDESILPDVILPPYLEAIKQALP